MVGRQMVSKKEILERIQKDMREKGLLNRKYSGCLTKKKER